MIVYSIFLSVFLFVTGGYFTLKGNSVDKFFGGMLVGFAIINVIKII